MWLISEKPLAIALLLALGLLLGPAAAPSQPPSPDELRAVDQYLEALWTLHESYGAEVPFSELVGAAIGGMLRTLDPHTSYLSRRAYRSMRGRQRGSFFGVGILISRRDGRVVVIAPIEGSPAWRAGLQSGDVIQAIDGEPAEGLTMDEAVERIKGPEGTEVTLEIARPGLDEPLTFTIARAEIPQETVRYAYLLKPEVGYVRLTDFSQSSAEEMAAALARLRQQGMERLVLDLRNNGGGLFKAAVEIADQFLPAGARIVDVRGRLPSNNRHFDAGDDHPELALPLVVLVNAGTASAAEILAGALQDHDVGLVVGTPTWGKGLVQTVYNLSYGAGLALTTARYYTPSGRLIQRDYGSFFDYYAHEGPEPGAGPGGEAGATYATDLGRPVYGGGGITPDVEIESPELPPGLARLFAHNAFFDFAVDFRRRHEVPGEDWRPGNELLVEFVAWLRGRDILDDRQISALLADREARDYALRQLHADVFTGLFGPEAAHRVMAGGDRQIQAALEQLDEAAELAERRRLLTAAGAPRPAPLVEPLPPAANPTTLPSVRADLWPTGLQAAASVVRARLLADAGSYRDALAAYRRATELDPTDPYAHLELARFHLRLARASRTDATRRRHLDAAVGVASRAGELAPDDPDVRNGLAEIETQVAGGTGGEREETER